MIAFSVTDAETFPNFSVGALRAPPGDSRLGSQMLREPLGRDLRRVLELIGVRREMAA